MTGVLQDDLHAKVLRGFDSFGQIIITGEEEYGTGGLVPGDADKVQPQLQVHALLHTVNRHPAQTDLHPRFKR